MFRYIVRRILISIPVLVVASFLCFCLVTAMGDPLGDWKAAKPRSPGAVATEEHVIGYDQPFFQRYGNWAVHFLEGDWNKDVTPGSDLAPVKSTVMSALWTTVKLVLIAELIAIIIGVVIGVIGAVRQYSIFDYTVTSIAFALFSMPLFCIAIMVKAGGIQFNNWLESIGVDRWITTAGPPKGGFSGDLGHQLFQYSGAYLLPVICLLAIEFALYSRFQRGSMLDVLNTDYVRTAQAKGLSQARVTLRHAFRNALIPVVTVASLNVGQLFSGAVITETVFGWQGMGVLIVHSVHNIEPWMVLGWLMVTAAFIILFNLIADIVYAFLDPRIRLD